MEVKCWQRLKIVFLSSFFSHVEQIVWKPIRRIVTIKCISTTIAVEGACESTMFLFCGHTVSWALTSWLSTTKAVMSNAIMYVTVAVRMWFWVPLYVYRQASVSMLPFTGETFKYAFQNNITNMLPMCWHFIIIQYSLLHDSVHVVKKRLMVNTSVFVLCVLCLLLVLSCYKAGH